MIHPLVKMTIKGAIWDGIHRSYEKSHFICITQLWRSSGFQESRMQTIIKTSTTALFLLWLMTGGWPFTEDQEETQLQISPLDLSRSVGVTCKLFYCVLSQQNKKVPESLRLNQLLVKEKYCSVLGLSPGIYSLINPLYLQLSTYIKYSTDDSFPNIRWHQTADFGFAPNLRMQKTFMAVAMDLPDETSKGDA